MNAQPLWVDLARITIGFIFFAAAVAKWRRPSAFSKAVESYDLVPKAAVRPVALLVLSLESVLAAMLLLGVLVDVALVGSAAALAAFAVVLARTVLRNTALDCGCLGAAVPLRLGWTTAVANAVLSVAGVTAALLDARRCGPARRVVRDMGERVPDGSAVLAGRLQPYGPDYSRRASVHAAGPVTALETLGFGILWVAVLILFALVLLLYRQVEKAYRRSYASSPAESLVGAEVPAVEILGSSDEYESIDFTDVSEWTVAAFVSSSCDACSELMSELAGGPIDRVDRLVVVPTDVVDTRNPLTS